MKTKFSKAIWLGIIIALLWFLADKFIWNNQQEWWTYIVLGIAVIIMELIINKFVDPAMGNKFKNYEDDQQPK